MKTTLTIITVIFLYKINFSQITGTNSNNIWIAKEFSKEISLFKSKEFLCKSVLGASKEIVQFEVIPLAAASSGELTTLLYKCDTKQMEGLILGFYGNYLNETGVPYQGFSFKNLEKEKAIEFLNKIETSIDNNHKFLTENGDNNNILFKYEDIDVLVWSNAGAYTIRVFWNGFDSTWEETAFERSKKRFERKIK
jgi:hypothetical protein